MTDVRALRMGGTLWDTGESAYIADLKQRSPDAWASLFDAYHDKIRRLAWAELRSSADADDIASTVFLRALHAIDSYVYRGTPIVSWLYQIARNVIKERRRRAVREKLTLQLDDEQQAGGATASREHPDALIRKLDLLDALSRVTQDQREVLTLIYVSGFSVREVAQILGKGERAVYYIQARGLMSLRRHIES